MKLKNHSADKEIIMVTESDGCKIKQFKNNEAIYKMVKIKIVSIKYRYLNKYQ